MVSHSNPIIFFSLILVLLIPCDEVKGSTVVSEVGFAGDGNGEQFLFDFIL